MDDLKSTLLSYKGLFEKSKPFLIKSIPYIIVLIIGFSIGSQSAEKRIEDDCKYINKFRVHQNGYNCARQI